MFEPRSISVLRIIILRLPHLSVSTPPGIWISSSVML